MLIQLSVVQFKHTVAKIDLLDYVTVQSLIKLCYV